MPKGGSGSKAERSVVPSGVGGNSARNHQVNPSLVNRKSRTKYNKNVNESCISRNQQSNSASTQHKGK